MLKHHESFQGASESENAPEGQILEKRRSLLALVALAATTAGCSSGSSSSVRDTDPYPYYGHGHYNRSPNGRRRGYRRW